MLEQAKGQQRPNPFDYTRPAEGPAFVGREEELQRVREVLCTGTPKICLVIGGAKVGKTSFIEHLEDPVYDIYVSRINCRSIDAPVAPMEWLGEEVTKALDSALNTAIRELGKEETELFRNNLVRASENFGQVLDSFQEQVQHQPGDERSVSAGDIWERLQNARGILEEVRSFHRDEGGRESRTKLKLEDALQRLAVVQGTLNTGWPEVGKAIQEIYADLRTRLEELQRLWNKRRTATITIERLAGYRPPFDARDFQSLGRDLRDLHEDIKPVLAFDDFDHLLTKGFPDADQLTDIFRCLTSLRGNSDLKIRILQSLSDEPQRIINRRYPHPPESLRIEFRKWRSDSQDTLLSVLREKDIEDMVRQEPSFPAYLAREVWRESGGHPLLAQALCYFAFEHYKKICETCECAFIDWIAVIQEMAKSKDVQRFVQESFADLPSGTRELIQEVAQRRDTDEIGRLPNEITLRPGLPKRLLAKIFSHLREKKRTRDILNSLMGETRTRGLVFREDPTERQSSMPYLIRIDGENDGKEYVIASRFSWRFLMAGVPRRARTVIQYLPEIAPWQMFFVILDIFLVSWLLFRWFNMNPFYAIPIALLVPLYSALRAGIAWIMNTE